jgi:hypothetical protein
METPEEVIGRELASGERLLWSGRPHRGLRFGAADVYLIPFGLLWTAFAVGGIVSLLTREDSSSGAAIGVPFMAVFVGIGLYLLLGRNCMDARWRRRTWYGVTSERVVLVTAWFGQVSVYSAVLRLMPETQLTLYRGGGGRIDLAPVPPPWQTHAGWPGYQAAGTSLELAADARAVYELIRGVQRSATTPAEPALHRTAVK